MVTRLKEIKGGKVEVVVDLNVEHGGYLNNEKRKELNLEYLKEYEKLEGFWYAHRNQAYMATAYCNLDWNIDWIDS
jgi:hypothetical protein